MKKSGDMTGREKVMMVITAAAILLAASVIIFGGKAPLRDIETAGIQDLSTEGFMPVTAQASVEDGRGLIALSGRCYRMVAGTEPQQAESVIKGIDRTTGPRPNTHELMRDVFENLGIELVMVKITELRGENFISEMIIRQGNNILALDSKPSDGIALAIRTNSTVYFNETLMREMGEKIC